jgi:hypothetical protein
MPFPRRFGNPGEPTKGEAYLTKGADVLSFILGCTTEFSIHFVGELYFAEILMASLLPIFLILRGKRALRRELITTYTLMGFWLVGLVISDVYHQIDIYDRMRGSALIIFFGINILSLSIVLGKNEKRKVLYLVGLMVGSLLSVKLQPSPAFGDYPWKFGYAFGAIQLAMLLSAFFYARRRYVVAVSIIFGMCLVNLLLNFRSPVLGMLLTVVLVFPIIPERVVGMRIVPQSQIIRLALLAFLAFVAAEAASGLVSFVTQAGYLNEEAQAKNESQAKMGILGGRPEFAVGLQAALDSPIIGHGSWAKDIRYLEMLTDLEVEAGTIDNPGNFEADTNGLIPGHSQIITAWVWSGIAGLIFWLYMIWFFLKGIVRVALLRPPMAPVFMTFLTGMWWDIFFSPFAANRRIIESFLVVLVADLVGQKITIVQDSWRRMGAMVPVARLRPRPNGSTAPVRRWT